jgi:imidazolonepropionase-like amidohydrolase
MKNILFIALLLTSYISKSQITYLHCGRLMTGLDASQQTEVTIIVEKDLIKNIQKGYLTAPKGATTIDLKNKTVLPGLIDCHVHLEWEQSRNSYNERFVLNEADIAFRSLEYARKTIMAGFTTVRDLGGQGVNIALRNAINKGLVVGPRIYTAGHALSITGGHGDNTTGAKEDLFDPPTPEEGIADGPDECRKAVRSQVKRGADCIKVCATGGVLSLARDGKRPQYAEDELKVIVQTAKDFGIHVAAHAHGDDGIRRAVEAGVNSIEHGTFMSEATMEAMVKYGTYYVPTMTAGWAVSDSATYAKGFFPEVVRVKALGIGPKMNETAAKCYKKGVKIAFGTDSGVYPHGLNGLEFGLMTKVGIPAFETIKSATINAATLLRIEDKLGSLEVGKIADIIAVPSNPLDDISVMTKVTFVMKAGIIVKEN